MAICPPRGAPEKGEPRNTAEKRAGARDSERHREIPGEKGQLSRSDKETWGPQKVSGQAEPRLRDGEKEAEGVCSEGRAVGR